MEVQSSDSKKLYKVFDASNRRRAKKNLEGPEDINYVGTDDSNGCAGNAGRIISVKASVHQVQATDAEDGLRINESAPRSHGSNPAINIEGQRSPKRHRRLTREGISLALKSGLVSTPRSVTPPTGAVVCSEHPSQDHDSLIYAFLEEAIKRDKKKQRHERRHEERNSSRERNRERDEPRDHRHRHRHRRQRDHVPSRDREKSRRESPSPDQNQAALLETFAKICAQMNSISPVRTHSHKSLQCEVASRREIHSSECRPERNPSREHTQGHKTPTRVRSHDNCRQTKSREYLDSRREKIACRYDEPQIDYEKDTKYISRINCSADKYSPKVDENRSRTAVYPSRIDETRSRAVVGRVNEDERYRSHHPPDNVATRTCIGSCRDRQRDRDYREMERRHYEDERRRYVEQKTSRSFETHREGYEDGCRRTSRSDTKNKRYDDRYYDSTIPEIPRHFPKDPKPRRPADRDRFERNSVTSREEEYRDRDRYSERERDSGLSVADGESTVSGRTGRSNYMKAVKQEIAEQREAMDKMMQLWKELMRCFKGMSQEKNKDKSISESACENVRESAAAQLRLWRECMRRYETVARDVGDTDARLMEEINKQRSEMSEMASMWQECLQRYRDMSNDFNTLKQQLATAESPTRLPPEPVVCAEGERAPPPSQPLYRMPHAYPQIPTAPGPGFPCAGSPLRSRASAPPAWWWGAEHPARHRSSRRSSPDSRDGRDTDRDRERRHRNKDAKDVPRYKEKSSKPSAARSEHRRRKR